MIHINNVPCMRGRSKGGGRERDWGDWGGGGVGDDWGLAVAVAVSVGVGNTLSLNRNGWNWRCSAWFERGKYDTLELNEAKEKG